MSTTFRQLINHAAKLTSLVCAVWGHSQEAVSAEIPDWGGCEAPLEAVKEDLARYDEWRGRWNWDDRMEGFRSLPASHAGPFGYYSFLIQIDYNTGML